MEAGTVEGRTGAVRGPRLTRFAWLSIAAAVTTIALKLSAWGMTGSVGLLSDAMESGVNLAGAAIALAMLSIAARPVDREHEFGHGKAEYFSSGAEGALILAAAAAMIAAAVPRFSHPVPLERLGAGAAVSAAASAVNLAVAIVLRRAGRMYDSITLEADAGHLMTDVLTSAGVLAGMGAVAVTGWAWLDPVIAVLVAVNILRTGSGIVHRSVDGLMDAAIPDCERNLILQAFDRHRGDGVEFHDLRTRRAGAVRFVSFHVLVPGDWTVERGHLLLESIEGEIRGEIPGSTVFTHIEPAGDPSNPADAGPSRHGAGGGPCGRDERA